MELRQLQIFATATELQSFTRAADAHAVSQAAVSQHIASLEKEFRTSFFQRGGRSVTSTEAGRCLYQYVRKVLDLLDEVRREIGQIDTPVRGTLRIAACAVAAESLLPELLARFRRLHPEVRESLTVSDSSTAEHAVEIAAAEVAIIGELPHSENLRAEAIACEEFILVVAPDHNFSHCREVSAAQIRGEPFIFREPGSGSRHCIEHAFDDAGISASELRVVMEVNSNAAIREAVKQGVGIAFLPRTSVHHEIADERLVGVPVSGVRPRRSLYLVTGSQSFPTAALRGFLACINQRLVEDIYRSPTS